MNARSRMVALLTADGRKAPEIAKALGLSARQVEHARAQPDVKDLIARCGRDGISPEQRLEILTYSTNDRTAFDASAKLASIRRASPEESVAQCPPSHDPLVRRARLYEAANEGYIAGWRDGRQALRDELRARLDGTYVEPLPVEYEYAADDTPLGPSGFTDAERAQRVGAILGPDDA